MDLNDHDGFDYNFIDNSEALEEEHEEEQMEAGGRSLVQLSSDATTFNTVSSPGLADRRNVIKNISDSQPDRPHHPGPQYRHCLPALRLLQGLP